MTILPTLHEQGTSSRQKRPLHSDAESAWLSNQGHICTSQCRLIVTAVWKWTQEYTAWCTLDTKVMGSPEIITISFYQGCYVSITNISLRMHVVGAWKLWAGSKLRHEPSGIIMILFCNLLNWLNFFSVRCKIISQYSG